ncbi:MAG: FAD-binding protein [Caldilineaceae bacterium]
MRDLLVIGAGWSGLSAALTAANHGLTVRVIAKGLGSMHWTAGSFDLLGYPFGHGTDAADTPVTDPLAAIADLPAAHPLARVGQDDVRSHRRHAHCAGRRRHPLRRPGGRTQSAAAVAGGRGPPRVPGHRSTEGRRVGPTRAHACGRLPGHARFLPAPAGREPVSPRHQRRAEHLPLDLITPRRDINTVQMAQALDAPDVQKRLEAALNRLVRPASASVCPHRGPAQPCRGLCHSGSCRGRAPLRDSHLAAQRTGRARAPGLRGLLETAGVRAEAGMEVVGFQVEDGRVAWVETATSARPLKHRAKAFLVATGGILGGGITGDHSGRIWETALDLPLTIPPDRSRWFRPGFFDEAGQPVFQGGVAVDDHWQPVDDAGARVYANVWAAGNLLAHADGILERSLEGIALATGVAAARSIVEAIES